MDLWLQITLCVLGGMFLLLLIHTGVQVGIKYGLTLIQKGELLGLECSQKLDKVLLEEVQKKKQFYLAKASHTYDDRGVLAGLNYAEELIETVLKGNQKMIDSVKEDLKTT